MSVWIAVRVAVVAVAVVCVGFAVFTAMTPKPAPSTWVSPLGAQQPQAGFAIVADPPVALFVGDSYTAGDLGISSSETFPDQTCAALGLTCNLDGEGSTGYQANGHIISKKFSPYVHRLPADARKYTANLIVVSGGRNDIGADGSEFTAVRNYLDAVQATYPKARVVVLEPFWTSSTPPSPVVALRRSVRRATAAAGIVYIPTNGWLTRSGVGSDGVHPNRSGHEMIAKQLIAALRASNVLTSLGHS